MIGSTFLLRSMILLILLNRLYRYLLTFLDSFLKYLYPNFFITLFFSFLERAELILFPSYNGFFDFRNRIVLDIILYPYIIIRDNEVRIIVIGCDFYLMLRAKSLGLRAYIKNANFLWTLLLSILLLARFIVNIFKIGYEPYWL